MKEIYIAKREDFKEVTAFINGVFDENFPEFMEKVYTEENFMRAEHYCIKDNGEIAACVAVYPQTITCGKESIDCAWIGSVSVAKDKRGLGYMKLLMEHVNSVLEERGIPFAYLSGRRNRYGFYGYEITGIRNYFGFDEENVRLTIGFDNCKGYEFKELVEGDNENLDKVMELYKRRLFTARNREDMISGMRTWGYKPYFIVKNSEFAGYLTRKGTEISEIELVDSDDYLYVLGALIQLLESNVRVEARSWERDKCMKFAEMCERFSVETLGNMRIFDFARTLEFFVKAEKKIRELTPGSLNIKIEGHGYYSLKITENDVKTDRVSLKTSDILLTHSQLIRLMFTKGSDFMLYSSNKLVKEWFPLSYTPERVDEF